MTTPNSNPRTMPQLVAKANPQPAPTRATAPLSLRRIPSDEPHTPAVVLAWARLKN